MIIQKSMDWMASRKYCSNGGLRWFTNLDESFFGNKKKLKRKW